LATTDNSHPTCGQDHCVFTFTNAALFLIMTHDRSPFLIPNDVCTRFVRRLCGVSAQTVVRRFVFPPFLACPRSSRGVDLLVVHNQLLVLYHSGTHLHSWHPNFFLWLLPRTKTAMDFTTHCDHNGPFPRCVCGRYYRFWLPHHNQNPLYSCIGWLIYDTELCSSVNPVSCKCSLPMNPMDAQRYDLSKRSVSL
jgi:hypothetical protein